MPDHAAPEQPTAEYPPPPPIPPQPLWSFSQGGPISQGRSATLQEPRVRANTRLSQTAIVVCCIVICIALVAIVLALTGDPSSGGGIVFFAMLLGTIVACIFHKRWR